MSFVPLLFLVVNTGEGESSFESLEQVSKAKEVATIIVAKNMWAHSFSSLHGGSLLQKYDNAAAKLRVADLVRVGACS